MPARFSRRSALKGLGALGLGAALPTSAAATPARRDHHTISADTFSVGDATVTVIRDTSFALPLSAVGTNVDAARVVATLAEYGLPTDRVPTDVSQLVIDHGGVRTLVDTGTGQGALVSTMAALGMAPASVDRVVVSHFHGDHIGGVSTDGVATFPNASVHFPAPELAFLEAAPSGNENVENALAKLAPVRDRLQAYRAGDELVPGLTAVAAHGHTPGHMAFELASAGARLLIVSDAVAHPVVFFRHPTWLFGFDMNGPQTVATRRRLLARAAREGTPLFASHMPFPGVGRVSVDGVGFRFTPVPMG
ncbi:MBL fold metallo-hydrolase [Rubrivirga sp. IMCC45206]|uniref:MBL fold metallo-hydrolase n=1 Tax=Rubrivirga sp. IMCC45206 TaxID=3391614 RepID=UPI0039903749